MSDVKETITLNELNHITETCLGVLSNIDKISSNQNDRLASYSKDVIGSLRKLLVATALYKQQIICIAGLQGAGKTTLLSNFYGINDILHGTFGVGERVPVIITEKEGISTPQLYSVYISRETSDDYKYQEIEVKENYDEATHADNINVMYFKLYVPSKYLKNSYGYSTAFMLLPGHEPERGENFYWNTLIDFALNSSDAAVFVLNERRMSDYGGTQYLQQVKKVFGNNLIYVLTHSDESSDENETLKKILINELNIPDSRIVCSGYYPDNNDKDETWKNNFMTAIERYAKDALDIRNRNNEYIYAELITLRKTLVSIRGMVKQLSRMEQIDSNSEEIIDTFDEHVATFRKVLENALSTHYGEAAKESIGKLDNEEKKKAKQGVTINKIIKNVKRFFGLNNTYERFVEPKENIKELLTDSDNNFIPDKHLCLALHDVLDKLSSPKEGDNIIKQLIDTKIENNHTILIDSERNQTLTKDLTTMLSTWKSNDVIPTIDLHDKNELCSAIVELGTYYLVLSSCNLGQNNTTSIDMSYDPAEINPDVDHILEGANDFKKFAVGIAGMMGVDAISDGAINFLPQIAESIGVSLSKLSFITCAALVISSSITISRDINTMNFNDYKIKTNAIYRIYDELTQDALSTYDDFMHKIRTRISSNLRKLDGNGLNAIYIHNARAEITNAINIIDTVIERCRGQAIGMGVLLQ